MKVIPSATRYEMLLTAMTPVSHHDPAVQDDSNRLLFNRQKQVLAQTEGARLATAEQMATLARTNQVPIDIAAILEGVSFPEFVAVCLTRTFMDVYNSQEGTGLFSGMERYDRLETRLRTAAIPSPTLREWWNRMCRNLDVPIHGQAHDVALFDLLSVPLGTQQQVLKRLAADYRSVVSIARLWHTTAKLESDDYAAAVGKEAIIQPKQTMAFEESRVVADSLVAEIPAVSANSLRHQMVREPAWMHLMQTLNLDAAEPGQGPVPAGVEAVFYNGGNIEAGAKQPSNVYALAHQIRQTFPSLDLLGGVVDSFDLGESRLQMSAWLVCAENRDALVGSDAYDLPNARVSVFDMMDDVTLTRQAGRVGLGQMIWSFETLATGAQVLARMTVVPQTNRLTHGALVAALDWFLCEDGTIGGQAARGFGHCAGDLLSAPPEAEALASEYEDYLGMRRDELIAALTSGKMGTDKQMLT